MSISCNPSSWVADLPPVQQRSVEGYRSEAKTLAGQMAAPLLLRSVLDELAPGYGETLARLLKRPDLLAEIHHRLVSEKSIAPVNVLNGGFGGI